MRTELLPSCVRTLERLERSAIWRRWYGWPLGVDAIALETLARRGLARVFFDWSPPGRTGCEITDAGLEALAAERQRRRQPLPAEPRAWSPLNLRRVPYPSD